MSLTPPPAIPIITDPSSFAQRAQDWVVWQANEFYQFIIEASALMDLSTATTSSTLNSISETTKTFVVESDKGFRVGMSVKIAHNQSNLMTGVVVSYSGTSLVVNVSSATGSGSYSSWSIYQIPDSVLAQETIETSGTPSVYIGTTKFPIGEFTDGKILTIKFHATCNANATIQLNGELPLLDLKIKRSDGVYAPVASGDIVAGDSLICMIVQNGTSILLEPSVARSNINYITANTTLTLENSLDITHVVNATATLTLPALSTFVEGASFNVVSNATATINRAGSDVISLFNADVTTMTLSVVGSHVIFVKSGGKWLVVPINYSMPSSWQDLTASRVLGTTYTNTSGRPRYVHITTINTGTSNGARLTVGEVLIRGDDPATGTPGFPMVVQAIVPAGQTYIASNAAQTLTSWLEITL